MKARRTEEERRVRKARKAGVVSGVWESGLEIGRGVCWDAMSWPVGEWSVDKLACFVLMYVYTV